MKNTLHLLYTLLLILLYQSCKRENPCENYTSKSFSFKLKEDTKNQIPYNGTETLTFIGNDNDTAILIGQGKNYYIQSSRVTVNGNPECPQYDNYSSEFIDLNFQGSNPNLSEIFIRFYNEKYWGDENTVVYLNGKDANFEAYTGRYNDTTIYNTLINIGSQLIKGYSFNRNDNKMAFVYNKQYGLLQITIDSNTVYTLNK